MIKFFVKEVGLRGINVNVVVLGYIEIDMIEVLGDKYKEEVKKNILFKKLGKLEDVVNVVVFFFSEVLDYVIG